MIIMQDCYYAFRSGVRNTHRKAFLHFPSFYILISSSSVSKAMLVVVDLGRLTAANFHRSRKQTHALASISYPLGRKDFEI